MKLTIPLPQHFSLHTTINSHGWYDLQPFRTNDELTELTFVLSIKKKFFLTTIRATKDSLIIHIPSEKKISTVEKQGIKTSVKEMLRIDERFNEFYSLCKTEPHLKWVQMKCAGRLLRSPSVFEDVVKMLFTTNCSWSLTKIQTRNLVEKLGTPISENIFSFPSPERIAGKNETWIRKEISCGYRAPYLLELCKNISSRKIELEHLRHSQHSTEEIYLYLRSIKGIGHYAAGNILKLLGRYDYLGIDSWVRKCFSEIHRNGRKVSDKTIERYYHRFGSWRGLVCWMEVTSDWHK